ncbi:MAG: VOC family protein [Flavipsychrobacter sp.]
MSNAINWFELPAVNLERAIKFYSAVLNIEMQKMEMNGDTLAFFPTKDNGVGGCLLQSENAKPSKDGALVYLNGGEDLSTPLSKIESAGGTVIMPKTAIGENGFIAMFNDTEGNKVALHSMS